MNAKLLVGILLLVVVLLIGPVQANPKIDSDAQAIPAAGQIVVYNPALFTGAIISQLITFQADSWTIRREEGF